MTLNKSLFWMGIVAVSLWSQNALARLPEKPTGNVNDFAGVLEPKTRSALSHILSELQSKTGISLVLATVADLEGSDIDSAANQLFAQWGIGQKGSDEGVLILMAPNEKRVRIEVGYGLEGVLPDGKAGEIIRSAMVPRFKAGQMEEGLVIGTLSVADLLAQSKGVTLSINRQQQTNSEQKKPATLGQKIFSAIVLVLLAILFIRHPFLFLFLLTSGRGGGFGGGGFSGGGFGGGFGGGMSGGGGSSGGW